MIEHIDRITHRDLPEYLTVHYEAKEPVLLWGHSSIGKTEAIEDFAERMGMDCVVIELGNSSPEEFAGQRVFEPGNDREIELKPWWFPARAAIVFLDEIGLCIEEVRGAAFRLILKGCIGNHQLPEDSWVVGATNTSSDGSAHNQLAVPSIARFGHVELVHDVEQWLEDSRKKKVRNDIRAFIRAYPNELFRFTPDKYRVEPRPRKWSRLSNVMNRLEARSRTGIIDLASHVTRCAITGQVGVPAGEQMMHFLEAGRSSPLANDTWAAARGTTAEVKAIVYGSSEITLSNIASLTANLPQRVMGGRPNLIASGRRAFRIMVALAEYEMETDGSVPACELCYPTIDEIDALVRAESEEAADALSTDRNADMRRFAAIIDSKSVAPEHRAAQMQDHERWIAEADENDAAAQRTARAA